MTPNQLTAKAREIFKGCSKSLFVSVLQNMGAERFYKAAASVRRKELLSELRSELGNKVLSGPFKGMIVPDLNSWGDGDSAAKIIGTYESNIREVLRKAIERAPDIVINVGCAEGYYAVGLARLLPNAKVYAFDIDTKAVAVCRQAAEENGAADRLVVGGLCTTESLSNLTEDSRHVLIVMDCEGAEQELLDPVKVPALVHCDIIVETHDFIAAGITAMLEKRLSYSHDVERISQGGRNPNELEKLSRFCELDRWLMINENRPGIMTWLACWARSAERR